MGEVVGKFYQYDTCVEVIESLDKSDRTYFQQINNQCHSIGYRWTNSRTCASRIRSKPFVSQVVTCENMLPGTLNPMGSQLLINCSSGVILTDPRYPEWYLYPLIGTESAIVFLMMLCIIPSIARVVILIVCTNRECPKCHHSCHRNSTCLIKVERSFPKYTTT